MPRVKKTKFTVPEEPPKLIAEKGAKLFMPPPTKFRIDRISSETFILITLYSTAVLLIFIGFATVYTIVAMTAKEMRNSSRPSVSCGGNAYAPNTPAQPRAITYTVEKTNYTLGDEIKLSITNNSNKPIYLAPCAYFNNFEKQIGTKWQSIILDDCTSVVQQVSGAFEKIPKQVEEKIPTAILGEGVWRGVSDVYFDCQKAKTESCQGKQTVYSNEFRIKPEQKTSVSGKNLSDASFKK